MESVEFKQLNREEKAEFLNDWCNELIGCSEAEGVSEEDTSTILTEVLDLDLQGNALANSCLFEDIIRGIRGCLVTLAEVGSYGDTYLNNTYENLATIRMITHGYLES